MWSKKVSTHTTIQAAVCIAQGLIDFIVKTQFNRVKKSGLWFHKPNFGLSTVPNKASQEIGKSATAHFTIEK